MQQSSQKKGHYFKPHVIQIFTGETLNQESLSFQWEEAHEKCLEKLDAFVCRDNIGNISTVADTLIKRIKSTFQGLEFDVENKIHVGLFMGNVEQGDWICTMALLLLVQHSVDMWVRIKERTMGEPEQVPNSINDIMEEIRDLEEEYIPQQLQALF